MRKWYPELAGRFERDWGFGFASQKAVAINLP